MSDVVSVRTVAPVWTLRETASVSPSEKGSSAT
jgi:hypothetical protein